MMKFSRFNNKKANMLDIVFLMVIVVGVIIACVPVFKMISKVVDFAQTDDGLTADDKAQMVALESKFYNSVDIGFLILLIVGIMVTLISAYLIDINPIFAVFGFIIGILSLIGCAVLVKVSEQVMAVDISQDVFANLTIIPFVVNNLFLVCVVFFALLMIVLYGKFKQG